MGVAVEDQLSSVGVEGHFASVDRVILAFA
jgi:hypothetical protein